MGFDEKLDEETGTKPKQKTPEEMKQDPNDFLDMPGQTIDEQQKKLDDTWQVTSDTSAGEPHHKQPPGSGASEGRGDHSWGVDDGDRTQKNK